MMHGNEVLPLNHLTHSNPLRPTQPTRGMDRSGSEWVGVGRRISMIHGNEVLRLNHLTHSDPRNPLRPTQPTQISHPPLLGVQQFQNQSHMSYKRKAFVAEA